MNEPKLNIKLTITQMCILKNIVEQDLTRVLNDPRKSSLKREYRNNLYDILTELEKHLDNLLKENNSWLK